MRASPPGEAVLDLAWLCPGADALLALARADAAGAWSVVRGDPGAALLAVRHGDELTRLTAPFSPHALHDAALLEAALLNLRESSVLDFVDWRRAEVRPVHDFALRCARVARRLAGATRHCDPDHAWLGALLAPLGWLTVCAVDPARAQACFSDPEHARHPVAVEKKHWGHDGAALARRLARHWRLPPWLAALVGHLGLPADVAVKFGAVSALFHVVQTAVALVQEHEAGLRLEVGATPAESSAVLGLSPSALDALVHDEPGDPEGEYTPPAAFRPPAEVPLLGEVLRLAADNRRLRGGTTLRRIEEDLDHLHESLREARAGEAERLQAQKLNALAEFAAGAGHEINNPLAVISGQAQFLLNKLRGPRSRLLVEAKNGHAEPAPVLPAVEGSEAEAALRKIVEQAQRVHQILRELMQFARPPQPHRQPFDLGALLREVAASQAELAAQRQVRLVCTPPEQSVALYADPAQVRMALACLLRNAVEAAPADGWAGLRVEAPAFDRVDVVVEDNGAGPPPQQREHLFDPFYSGRPAGRGRGLGLPTAWRLARQHGGDVRFVGLPNGPTRFVLSLARTPEPAENGNAAAPARNGAVH